MYPMNNGMAAYSLHGNPANPIVFVIAIVIKWVRIRYLHFGMFKVRAEWNFQYSSINFIPKQNSRRYCKKKLFHTRSSPNPYILRLSPMTD